MYRKTKTPLLFAGLVLVPMLLTACGESEANVEETVQEETTFAKSRTVRVSTITLELSTFEEIIPLTGVVSAPNDVSLSAQTSGTIVSMAELGTPIARGDVIARLDDRLILAALDQAKANLSSVEAQASLAEDSFRRQEPLYQDSIISAIEFENVRSLMNQANAALSQAAALVVQAEQQFEHTFVRAPFSGIVEQRFAERGEQVTPGVPLVRIVDTTHLKVSAGVPESYASDVKNGTEVEISFLSYGGPLRSGRVSFVANVIDPQTRTFLIEIEIDNQNQYLKPEMIADVFVTRRVLKNQLVLPQTAILRDELGSSVYVVVGSDSGATARRQAITLGASYGGDTVALTGLSAGDIVITTGQTMVAEGDHVDMIEGS